MDVPSEELLRREDVMKQFDVFFENTTNTLNNFVDKIGWSLDETPTNDSLTVHCPLKSDHKVLPSKLEDHCEKCKLKQNGYDSTHSLYPSQSFLSSSAQTMEIDEVTQMHILKTAYDESNFTLNIKHVSREVSQSIERYACDFTPDERRVLYDYVVKNTKPPSGDNLQNDLAGVDLFNKSDNEKPKSELEIMQEQRDSKRRRVAYRGKRVHTDRKSYIEVLREVVEGLTNTLSTEKDKFICMKTTNNATETTSNNRVVYKYEGNRNYSGNPYQRWMDIETEESELLKCYGKNDCSKLEASTSEVKYSRSKFDNQKLKKSRSRSREKKRSESKLRRSRKSRSKSYPKETKYKKSKRSRTPFEFKETKTRSKSKDNKFRKSKSRSKSTEIKHKKSKRHRTRSRSKEFSSRKKSKRSNSSISHGNQTLKNEKDTRIDLVSSDVHKKKKHKHKHKHKHKRTHSKSPERSRKLF